mgnify:CR=1 FL=1
MRAIKFTFKALLALLLLAAAAAGVYVWRSFPALDGALRVAGLSAPVAVDFDAHGVPRIKAANETDAATALGFLHARERMFQMCGVDLTRIDGIDVTTALAVISETGSDMSRFPSVKHFTSWLGLCPDNRITGGKPLTAAMIENVWITISKQGQALALSSLKDKGKPVPNLPQFPGLPERVPATAAP